MKKLVMMLGVLLMCSVLMPIASYGQHFDMRPVVPMPLRRTVVPPPDIQRFITSAIGQKFMLTEAIQANDDATFEAIFPKLFKNASKEQVGTQWYLLYEPARVHDAPQIHSLPMLMAAMAMDSDKIVNFLLTTPGQETMSIDNVKYLIFDYNKKQIYEGIDILRLAVLKGNRDLTDKLLATNPADDTKQMALAMAIVTGNDEMADLLRRAGATEPTEEQINICHEEITTATSMLEFLNSHKKHPLNLEPKQFLKALGEECMGVSKVKNHPLPKSLLPSVKLPTGVPQGSHR